MLSSSTSPALLISETDRLFLLLVLLLLPRMQYKHSRKLVVSSVFSDTDKMEPSPTALVTLLVFTFVSRWIFFQLQELRTANSSIFHLPV